MDHTIFGSSFFSAKLSPVPKKLNSQAISTPTTRASKNVFPAAASSTPSRLSANLRGPKYLVSSPASTTNRKISELVTSHSCLPSKLNLSLYTSTQSPGFASRIVQYDRAHNGRIPTHNKKYGSPGLFPIVHLHKRNLPFVSTKPKRVTVKIAPPDDLSMYNHVDHSIILSENSRISNSTAVDHGTSDTRDPGKSEVGTRSVLDALKEISRKRIHAAAVDFDGDSPDNNGTSKRNKRMLESPSPVTAGNATSYANANKRSREDTPPLSPSSVQTSLGASAAATNGSSSNSAKRCCTVDPLAASFTSSTRLQEQVDKTSKRKIEVSPESDQRKLKLKNFGTQTLEAEAAPVAPLPERVQLVELETTIAESALAHEQSNEALLLDRRQLFNEKPLQIFRKNKLAALLGALTGEEPEFVKLDSMDMTDNAAASSRFNVSTVDASSHGLTSIMSSPNKSKERKHVTFNLPSQSSLVDVTNTTSSLVMPISSYMLSPSRDTNSTIAPMNSAFMTANTTPSDGLIAPSASVNSLERNISTSISNGFTSLPPVLTGIVTNTPPKLGGFKFDLNTPSINPSVSPKLDKTAESLNNTFGITPIENSISSSNNLTLKPGAVDVSNSQNTAGLTMSSTFPNRLSTSTLSTNLQSGNSLLPNAEGTPNVIESSVTKSSGLPTINFGNIGFGADRSTSTPNTTSTFSFGQPTVTTMPTTISASSFFNVNSNMDNTEPFTASTVEQAKIVPSFGNPSTNAFGFIANDVKTTTATSPELTLFNNVGNIFGKPAVTTTSPNVFGNITTIAAADATTTATTNVLPPGTSPSIGGFSAPVQTPSANNVFGKSIVSAPAVNAPPGNLAFSFGSSSGSAASNTMPAFGNTNQTAKALTFGAEVNTTTPASTTAIAIPAASNIFGAKSSTFGVNANTSTGPFGGLNATSNANSGTLIKFGETASTTANNPAAGLFSFTGTPAAANAPTPVNTSSTVFGNINAITAPAGPFASNGMNNSTIQPSANSTSFNTKPSFGGFGGANTTTNFPPSTFGKTTDATNSAAFTFGAATSPSFGVNEPNTAFNKPTFGGATSDPFSSGGSFASTGAPAMANFATPASPPQQSGLFTFGSATATPKSPPGVTTTGDNKGGGVFAFGAGTPKPSTGGFNFSSGNGAPYTSPAGPVVFGAGAGVGGVGLPTAPTFNVGAAAFNAQPQMGGGPGMFSIGSGSSSGGRPRSQLKTKRRT